MLLQQQGCVERAVALQHGSNAGRKLPYVASRCCRRSLVVRASVTVPTIPIPGGVWLASASTGRMVFCLGFVGPHCTLIWLSDSAKAPLLLLQELMKYCPAQTYAPG
jgi:hypothetical protein